MQRITRGVSDRRDGSQREDRLDPMKLDAIEHAASVLCKRWKGALLCVLASDHQRYTAIARQLPAATPKMLTQQLRELERDGLVVRIARSGGARHVEYRLTPVGEALHPIVEALAVWGRQHLAIARAVGAGPDASDAEQEVSRRPVLPGDGEPPPGDQPDTGAFGADLGTGRAAS